MDARNRFSILKYKWFVNILKRSPVAVAVAVRRPRSAEEDTDSVDLFSPTSVDPMREMLCGILIQARTAASRVVVETTPWREVVVGVGVRVKARRQPVVVVSTAEVPWLSSSLVRDTHLTEAASLEQPTRFLSEAP
jgi:hypothetical protein